VGLLRGLLGGETRSSLENPQVPLTAATLIDVFGGPQTDAGVSVSEAGSLGIPAVWRAVQVITGAAALPLHTFKNGTRQRLVNRLIDNPHPDLTPFELWEWAYASVALWGNAYFRKVRNPAGVLSWLLPINPDAVKVGKVPYDPETGSTKVFDVRLDNGSHASWTSSEVLHIPGFGYDGVVGASPIRIARNSLGLAMAAEKHGAQLFGNNGMPAGVLSTEQRLTPTQAAEVKQRWKDSVRGRGSDIAVTELGIKFQPITMPMTDAQFIENRRFQVIEIARWFGIPPFMLFDVERSTSWGTGIEQQGIGFVVYTLRQWLVRFEQRITREATPNGAYSKYVVEGLLRGDSAARAAFYTAMRNMGAMNVDEIRDREDMEPLPDGIGQTYIQPLNMAPLGSAPADAPLDPNET
jgi:HK97 family phage portal protein